MFINVQTILRVTWCSFKMSVYVQVATNVGCYNLGCRGKAVDLRRSEFWFELRLPTCVEVSLGKTLNHTLPVVS